jgi:hypothetical protein
MRRGTLIAVIALAVLLVATAAIQFTLAPPPQPFPGPVSGTPFPPELSVTPSG